ncbi:glycosyl hydrolase family 95 catalytic domain-containing protein [Pseudoduganella sp. R-32]|uniref:glycoside hydrolase family 95 protein n=1 Tax=unclassified Pseudoduganella TaxID=2637179 RepID=UPI003CEC76B2
MGVNSRRRHLMVSLGMAAAFPGLAGAAVSATARGKREDLELWYARPAGPWVEALPVGNGRLGAMVYGRVGQERLQLNEDTLFAGGPHDPNMPTAQAALPQVRTLIDQGRFKEAHDLCGSTMISHQQMPYSSAGDLLIDFIGAPAAPSVYRRSLGLDSAVVHTSYAAGKVRYTREVFASAPAQVIVARLTATQGVLDFDLGYRHPAQVKYGATQAPVELREDLNEAARPAQLAIGADGDGALLVEGRNNDSSGIPGALRYAVRVQAIADGQVIVAGDRLQVRGARTVTLLVAAATSYVNFADTSGDPVARVRRDCAGAAQKPYALLRQEHVNSHQSLFRRFSIRLGKGQDVRPTSERIATAESQPDPTLAALYVQYARYLLLSCSRPGSEPANLQGLWNEGTNPPWGGKYTININTQMNYWPAGPANLGECVEPVLRMVEGLAVTGAITARKAYGARGWVTHHNTDLWRGSAPIDGPLWGIWPTGGAWLCNTLWDHYDYSRDEAWLRRLYPLMRGACLFFIDTLVEDPKGRGLVTSPSISPENQHHKGVAICAGPAMDRQILRDLFRNTLAAQVLLREDDAELRRVLETTMARLPVDRIGAQGQFQEWLEDWDAGAPEQKHRHVSHLYAIYPSSQANVRDTPQLVQAAMITLNTRGDKSTGWATAWRLALWARMGEGDRAHAILLGLLGPERTYPNMFDAHPPFQIDGNFGGAAGIIEMVLQSWGDEIHVLAALPKAWPEGNMRGIRARGGVEADVEWSGGRLRRLALRGKPGESVSVRYRGEKRSLKLDGKGRAAWILQG